MSSYHVIGAMVDRFNNDVDASAVTLRTLFGTGKAWADVAPESVAQPYLVFSHISTSRLTETKQGELFEQLFIQIDVYSETRSVVEIGLELCEAAYLRWPLTINTSPARTWLQTSFNNRHLEKEASPSALFHGVLELIVLTQK